MIAFRPSLRHILLVIVGICVVAVIATLICLVAIPRTSESVVKNTTLNEAIAPDPALEYGNFKILLAGTTFWGRNTNKMARASDLGIKYPFSGLHTLGRDAYDAWIAGLECPITENGHTDYNENTLLKFNCDPDYLSEAAKWFTALSLGNNHVDNWGAEGFATTKQNLSSSGIQYFGHYDYKNTTEICAPVIVPARLIYDDGTERDINFPVGFCGIHGVFGVPSESALQEIKLFSAILPTIVMPHMGAEYKPSADAIRSNLYRKLIDYGAEMVIGDHPHWIQNTEAYKSRLIVYSMGNFMFDQLWSSEVVRSAAISANAKLDPDVDFDIWDALAADCLIDRINCLENIKTADLKKPLITWDFAFLGTTSAATRITRLANPAEQAAIGERLNWSATLKDL